MRTAKRWIAAALASLGVIVLFRALTYYTGNDLSFTCGWWSAMAFFWVFGWPFAPAIGEQK